MPGTEPSDRDPSQRAASIPEVLSELKDMTVAYARQETIDPLKGLGRFVVFGIGGSFMLGIGVVLLTLGGLRALQTQTSSTFEGNWSWAPYAITLVLLVALAALAAKAITGKAITGKAGAPR